ncbi:hypothetical protein GXY_07475 [Novacetimonas hansenii ATCC 23769]|uniref:Uncharacterized protein n=1 Tax=Novacetimonas hansenii ATCC 23769 TaxID=714995 RepID=D5QED0_NOVHA|nr:hypothetical protein GXY_07475 [Novacetimonas hansenii ATCC 23769]
MQYGLLSYDIFLMYIVWEVFLFTEQGSVSPLFLIDEFFS